MKRFLKTYSSAILLLLVAGKVSAAPGDLRLIDAVRTGDQETVRTLLKQHAEVNAAKADGTTPLAVAAYRDDLETVDLLIQAKANVNAANEYGVTPLSLACSNRNSNIVDKLLKAGADPNIAQWNGETPLMTCTSTGSVEAVKLLLDHKANPNAKETDQDQTALMWAVAEKQPTIVRMLIQRGANVHARSKVVEIPEPFIVKTGSIFGQNHPPTVHFPKTRGGFTPLMFAAQQGDIESAKILLDAGANLEEFTAEDGTALVVAVASGHEKFAEFLLEKGANPNVKDAFGLTPLHYALHEGLLVVSGVKSANSDRFGWARPNMPGLVKTLLAHGADPNAKMSANLPTLEDPFLARSTEDSPQTDPVGATPFLLAAASGDVISMRTLVEGRADPRVVTNEGASAVMLASGIGSERGRRDEKSALDALKIAVELGGDVNAALPDGRTPLHAAAFHGWNEVVKFLVEKGAKLDAKDMYGETPLSIAMGDPEGRLYRQRGNGRGDERFRTPKERKDTVALLLKLGAPPFTGKVRDRSGE